MEKTILKNSVKFIILIVTLLLLPLNAEVTADYLKFENETENIGRGFGSTFNRYAWSMNFFKGRLYVGTWNVGLDYLGLYNLLNSGQLDKNSNITTEHDAQIWCQEPDGKWNMVRKADDKHTSGFRKMIVYKEKLYVGSLNTKNGCVILRTADGNNWQKLSGGPLENKQNTSIRTFAIHDDQLYVGTQNSKGGELWSYTADDDAGTWTIVHKFGKSTICISELAVFNDNLYVGTWASQFEASLSTYKLYVKKSGSSLDDVTPKFRGSRFLVNLGVMKLIEYKGELYLGTTNIVSGFTLLRSSTPDNRRSWKVITTRGMGDWSNAYCWSMVEYKNKLYLGTFNTGLASGAFGVLPDVHNGSAQLFSSYDGLKWTLEMDDGFDAPFTYGIRNMVASGEKLYLGTAANVVIPDPGSTMLDDDLLKELRKILLTLRPSEILTLNTVLLKNMADINITSILGSIAYLLSDDSDIEHGIGTQIWTATVVEEDSSDDDDDDDACPWWRWSCR